MVSGQKTDIHILQNEKTLKLPKATPQAQRTNHLFLWGAAAFLPTISPVPPSHFQLRNINKILNCPQLLIASNPQLALTPPYDHLAQVQTLSGRSFGWEVEGCQQRVEGCQGPSTVWFLWYESHARSQSVIKLFKNANRPQQKLIQVNRQVKNWENIYSIEQRVKNIYLLKICLITENFKLMTGL